MNTTFIYIITFAITVLLAYVCQKTNSCCDDAPVLKKLFLALVVSLPLSLLLGLRYGIGTDYSNYEDVFNYYLSTETSRTEIGYVALMNLCDNFKNVVLLSSIITVLVPIMTLVFKSNSYLWLQVLGLECFFLGFWCNAIRQAIALGFVVLSIALILQGKRIWFVCSVVIAGLFHASAFLLMPFVFFINKDNSFVVNQWWKYLLAFVMMNSFLAFFIFKGYDTNLLYSNYIGALYGGGTTSKYLLFSFLFSVPEIFLCKRICSFRRENAVLYMMLVYEVVLYVFTMYVAFAFRMGHYFTVAHIFLIPQAIRACDNKYTRFCLTSYYVVCLVLFFYVTTFMFKYNGIFEYRSIVELD